MSLTAPTTANSFGQDLRAAMYVGGLWDYDWSYSDLGWRIKVDSVSTEFVGPGRSARVQLSVNLAGDHDDAGNQIIPPLSFGELHRVVNHDTRICVHDGDGTFLFEGYPRLDTIKLVGTPGAEATTLTLLCTSLVDRLTGEKLACVYGSYVRTIEGASPVTRLVAAIPCIFNHKGRPNRAFDLDTKTFDGTEYSVPAFTYDGDPNGLFWTYADVVTYLIAYYLWPLGVTYPLTENVLSRCQTIVAADTGPAKLTDTTAPNWGEVVSQMCPEMTCEGMNLVKALQLWCEFSGCEFQQETFNTDGDPDTIMTFSVVNDGGPYSAADALLVDAATAPAGPAILKLEQEASTKRAAAQVLARNELEQTELLIDYQNTVASYRVLGDPESFEVTIGKCSVAADVLKPGWEPDTMFGDDAADVDAKVDEATAATAPDADGNSATMFARYDRRGADFSKYSFTGRFWVANESGEYDGTTYGRTNNTTTCWNSDAYDTPFNFHTICSVPKLTGDVEWIRRRRPITRLLSKGLLGVERPPLVKCSWDSGSHWYMYPGNCSFPGTHDHFEAQCAVYLTDQNLNEVKNTKPVSGDDTADVSVWEAIIRGTFRISITCTVQGDGRVTGNSNAPAGNLSFVPHEDILMVGELQKEALANSELASLAGWEFTAVDDTDYAGSYANRKLLLNQSPFVSGTVIIPWFTKDWYPGRLVSGIMPLGISFNGFGAYPRVVKVSWHNDENSQETHVMLVDSRTEIRIVDGQGQTIGGRRRGRH